MSCTCWLVELHISVRLLQVAQQVHSKQASKALTRPEMSAALKAAKLGGALRHVICSMKNVDSYLGSEEEGDIQEDCVVLGDRKVVHHDGLSQVEAYAVGDGSPLVSHLVLHVWLCIAVAEEEHVACMHRHP